MGGNKRNSKNADKLRKIVTISMFGYIFIKANVIKNTYITLHIQNALIPLTTETRKSISKAFT